MNKKILVSLGAILISSNLMASWIVNGQHSIFWKKAGVQTKEEALQWVNAGVEYPNRVREYKEKGITPDTLNKSKNSGINQRNLRDWHDLGITNDEDILKWKAVVTDGHYIYAKSWIDNGIIDPSEVKKWKSIGKIPFQVKLIKEANIEFEEYKLWQKTGVKEASTIAKAKSAGLSPFEYQSWSNIGMKNVKDIVELNKLGIKKPSDYQPYLGLQASTAKSFIQWKIKPNKLMMSMAKLEDLVPSTTIYFQNKDTFNKAYKAIKKECDKVEPLQFSNLDYTDSKDKCYFFSGTMMERDDKKGFFGKSKQRGLVATTAKRYVYVEFEGSWLTKTNKTGIVYGEGSHQFKASNGNNIVLPKGKVLYMKD